MKKQELLDCLKGLQRYQYIIMSGGSLVMRGLREETNDIDICVSEVLATHMGIHTQKPNEKGYYELPNGLDVTVGLKKVNCEVVDGYLCETLEEILKAKKKRNLPKDQKDIELIEEYFAQQGRS